MDQDFNAEAGVNVSLSKAVSRPKEIKADVGFRASIGGKGFLVHHEGRMILNPATGKRELCLRDQVGPHGFKGHWYDLGILTDNAIVPEIKALKRRRWFEKLFTRIKEFIRGSQLQ